MAKPSRRILKTEKIVRGLGCLSAPIFLMVLFYVFVPSVRYFFYSESVWDGFFPAGEYRFTITNEANEPLEGAKLNVFESDTQKPAFHYPIDNYIADRDLLSDESGLIVVRHMPGGFEFGGMCKQFFTVIMKCTDGPRYDFVITADGYVPVKFSDEVLYELSASDKETDLVSVIADNGQEVKLPIYELIYALEK